LDTKLLKRSYGFLGIVEGILALIFFLHYGGWSLMRQNIPFKIVIVRDRHATHHYRGLVPFLLPR
ncbi:MAG: hypothetical protein Q8838_02495, partial [Candidatus Phytoplasma australasiaticum]|nr:hypothetical protein [Candidatus Phytoplasma australasiaticum]